MSSRLGAIPRADSTVEFRVWSPNARSLAVRIGGEGHELTHEQDGFFAATLRAAPGDLYRFVVDGSAELPDPCSRFQPEGIRGPSCVVDVPRAARR